ncbi:MAG: hypothetical protein JWM88_2042, partial [Verrucomicrobia bacterium]|nr:hypothetical protein [Verrucomicrobiota bacterium]
RAEGVLAGQKRGIFRKGDPTLYVLALDGMICGLIRESMARGTSLSTAAQVEFVFTLGLRGMLSQP